MADFADQLSDERAGRKLARALRGKGAFRRFRDELNQEYPPLLPAWYAFRDAHAHHRAVEWLTDNSLVEDDAAARFVAEHLERPHAGHGPRTDGGRHHSGYSSFRQLRGPTGCAFGVRSSRKLK